MFTKIKHLLVIGLLFLIPACVTGQATGTPVDAVNIDATVEARLALIPTPTPQIVIQEVEVIVEKEVPIEIEVIKEVIVEKEVEVIKEVPVEVEKIVEKIVEVVVTATPTPKPTATPTPLPIPTATPIPIPTDKSSDFVVVTRSQAETKRVNRSAHKSEAWSDWKESTKFIDGLITNTHPNLAVKAYYHVKVIDDEGYFVKNEISTNSNCIFPNTTTRFRYEDVTEDSKGNKISIDVITRFEHEEAPEIQNEHDCKKVEIIDIDESLLNEVEIDISEHSSYSSWNLEIDVKNNSDFDIIWKGHYTVKDEYGYVLVDKVVEIDKIKPNSRGNRGASWEGKDNMPDAIKRDELFFVRQINPAQGVWAGYAFTTDLENFEATLRTIQLIKVD